MVVPHATKLEAREHFQESLDKVAVAGSKWMAALWCVEEGRVVLRQVTTSDFPHGDMCAAVGHLGVRLHEMVLEEKEGPKLPNDPLPKAADLGFRIAPTPDPERQDPIVEPVLDSNLLNTAGEWENKDEVADH